MSKTVILNVVKKDLDYWVKVTAPHWAEFMELLREGGDHKGTRIALRFEELDTPAMEKLRNQILVKIIEYNELYNQYTRELDSSKVTLQGKHITGLKKGLKHLELRLAALEQREPRKFYLRPLPVRYLRVD